MRMRVVIMSPAFVFRNWKNVAAFSAMGEAGGRSRYREDRVLVQF